MHQAGACTTVLSHQPSPIRTNQLVLKLCIQRSRLSMITICSGTHKKMTIMLVCNSKYIIIWSSVIVIQSFGLHARHLHHISSGFAMLQAKRSACCSPMHANRHATSNPSINVFIVEHQPYMSMGHSDCSCWSSSSDFIFRL